MEQFYVNYIFKIGESGNTFFFFLNKSFTFYGFTGLFSFVTGLLPDVKY